MLTYIPVSFLFYFIFIFYVKHWTHMDAYVQRVAMCA